MAELVNEVGLRETVTEDGLFPRPKRDERRFGPTDPPWPFDESAPC